MAVFFYKDVAPTELKQKAVNGYLFRNMGILPMFFLFLPCNKLHDLRTARHAVAPPANLCYPPQPRRRLPFSI